MKDNLIIPIFVPHLGCPNDCVFCNQRSISGQKRQVTSKDVVNIIEKYLGDNDFTIPYMITMGEGIFVFIMNLIYSISQNVRE